MHEPTPHMLTLHFTNLIGRKVSFVRSPANSRSAEKPIFGIYRSFPDNKSIVVMADLCLIGSLAGALVGLPDAEVRQRIAGPNLEELLADAVGEIFNVASPVVATQERAVFSEVVREKSGLKDDAAAVFSKPRLQFAFQVSIEGYQGGFFQVLA